MSSLAIPSTQFMEICIDLESFRANMEADWEQFCQARDAKLAQWQQLMDETRDYLYNFPKELRNRPMVKSLIEQIQSFETEAQKFKSQQKDRLDISLQNMRQRADELYAQFQDMENHPLVQRFLEGKKILSSRANLQWSRKFYHVFNGLLGLWLYAYSGHPNFAIGLLASYFVMAIGVEIGRRRSATINNLVCRTMGSMMREREKNKISSATWLMFSVLTILLVFTREVNILPILFVAIGDPVAGIVGSLWGKTKIAPHVSLQGCLAMFAVCFLMSLYFTATGLVGFTLTGFSLLGFSLLAATVGTLSESIYKKLDDNLTIPLISTPCIWVLIKLFV